MTTPHKPQKTFTNYYQSFAKHHGGGATLNNTLWKWVLLIIVSAPLLPVFTKTTKKTNPVKRGIPLTCETENSSPVITETVQSIGYNFHWLRKEVAQIMLWEAHFEVVLSFSVVPKKISNEKCGVKDVELSGLLSDWRSGLLPIRLGFDHLHRQVGWSVITRSDRWIYSVYYGFSYIVMVTETFQSVSMREISDRLP